MTLAAKIAHLAEVEIHPIASRLRARRIEQLGLERAQKAFPDYDWNRLSYVFRRLNRGAAMLDVGPGAGYLLRIVERMKKFDTLCAIDIVERKALPKSVKFEVKDIANIDYPDNSFDTITCLEVLEHLEDDALPKAIANLRRMCRGQLIMSVPFAEPLPLAHYHKQRFTESRIGELFPDAKLTLLLKEPVNRVPWMLIEEQVAPRVSKQVNVSPVAALAS